MRDALTLLAALLVAALTAALAVPPLVDWRAYRGLVDGAIARAVGTEVATEGALDIRLLPFPRLRAERLRLGATGPARATLDASFVKAEVALTPLLGGEIRFLDARIGRAEVKLPAGTAGAFRLPRGLVRREPGRSFAFEELAVAQLLVTTTDPGTGLTEQVYGERVRIGAGSLAGPWRLDGTFGEFATEAVLGEIGPDLSASLKLGATAGPGRPRLEFDGRLALLPGAADDLLPRLSGAARATLPAVREAEPGGPLPFTLRAGLVAAGAEIAFDGVALEIGEGVGAIRLAGDGRYRTEDGRLRLALAGRRLDLTALAAAAGGAGLPRLAALRGFGAGVPLDLSLRLDGVGLGGDEDLTAVAAEAARDGARVRITRFAALAPGAARLAGEAALTLGSGPPIGDGRFSVRAEAGDRFARFVEGFGGTGFAALLGPGPLDLAADITLADPVVALRNLRLASGPTSLTGTVRFVAPEGGARGRIDAQLGLQGLDLSGWPDGTPFFDAARRFDVAVVLDAGGIRYGAASGGRIAARFATEGPSIRIDRLEVAELAGAQARLAGRIAPDGSGSVEGRLTAARAAPLVDLFGRAWLGGAARLLPDTIREGPLDLSVRADRALDATNPTGALRTTLSGRLASGPLQARTLSADGRLRSLDATVSTDVAGAWFGLADAALRRPARLEITARRDGSGPLMVDGRGEVAGLRLATRRPFALSSGDDAVESGEAALAGEDARPFLTLLGEGAPPPGPVALDLTASLSRRAGPRLALAGRIAGTDVSADLGIPSLHGIEGSARVRGLSLPWLVAAFALDAPPMAAAPGAIWPSARFGRRGPFAPEGNVRIEAETIELGAGRIGREAAFTLAASPDGLALRDASLSMAGGRLGGEVAINRQGGLASLIGEARFENLDGTTIVGPPLVAARLSGRIGFGGSGESVAGLVANLGGAGFIAIAGAAFAGADPAGVARAVARALRSEDPLAAPRLAALVGEEIARGPFTAAGPASANATLTAGALRLAPLAFAAPAGSWTGTATFDLRTLTLDVRGALTAEAPPRGWEGGRPYATLGWSGPAARPNRTIDAGPLVNGLASVVLQRELSRIEVFELDAAERARLNGRTEFDRRRRLEQEEAARQARLQREREAERARAEVERQRLEAERNRAAGDDGASARSGPTDIRPPAQAGTGG